MSRLKGHLAQPRAVDRRLIRHGSRLSADDYLFRGFCGHDLDRPQGILFDPDYTRFAIVLQGRRNEGFVDSAICGFNDKDTYLDCLQLQGGTRRYRELLGIDWPTALLGELIALGNSAGLDAITLMPAIHVKGMDPTNIERLTRIYDGSARRLGFQYSADLQRNVREL